MIIGAWFKLQHWPGANIIASVGLVIMIVVYAVHYGQKPSKRLSDHLKLVWVLASFGASVLAFSYLVNWVYELKSAALVIFWCAFAAFVIEHKDDGVQATH